MADLKDFVLELSRDPQKVQDLKSDPDGVLGDSGLSEEDQALIRSGDVEAIRNRIAPEGRDGEGSPVIVVVVVL